MKKSIVFNSPTGNTKKLAETISSTIGESDVAYFGTPNNDALDSDLIFVGFWTTKFSCDDKVKQFLASLQNKKVFLFGTAGYNFTDEFFNNILDEVKKSLDPSNELVGTFMCQGKVSDAKQKAIKDTDEEKFNSMKPNLDKSLSHPDTSDLDSLVSAVKAVL